MPRTTFRIWLLALALALLAGCASRPPELPPALPDPTLDMPEKVLNGAIYQAGRDIRLYEDRSARRVGDLITIVLEEETDATKDASMDLSRESQLEFAAPTFGGEALTFNDNPLSAGFDASQSFDGGGGASQSNELTGIITAIVTKVYPNGNLRVEGQKKLTINRGDEYVTITGIVRPDDVSASNTVSSTRVALSKISYTGTGALADSSSMGWLSRIFMSVFSPF